MKRLISDEIFAGLSQKRLWLWACAVEAVLKPPNCTKHHANQGNPCEPLGTQPKTKATCQVERCQVTWSGSATPFSVPRSGYSGASALEGFFWCLKTELEIWNLKFGCQILSLMMKNWTWSFDQELEIEIHHKKNWAQNAAILESSCKEFRQSKLQSFDNRLLWDFLLCSQAGIRAAVQRQVREWKLNQIN